RWSRGGKNNSGAAPRPAEPADRNAVSTPCRKTRSCRLGRASGDSSSCLETDAPSQNEVARGEQLPDFMQQSGGRMPKSNNLDAEAFRGLFRDFLEQITTQAPKQSNLFLTKIQAHLGADPRSLPTIAEDLRASDHPNLQLALDAYLTSGNRSADIIGVTGEHAYFGLSLSQLLGGSPSYGPANQLGEGPVEYVAIGIGERVLTCVQTGLFLLRGDEGPLVVLVKGPSGQAMRQQVH